MLHTFYKLKIIGFNSMKKSNYFIFFAFWISNESVLKIYQSKIKFVKSPSGILTISIFKNKMSCQTEKQVDEKKVLKNFIVKNSLIVTSIRLFFNIILLMVILFVHLMSPDSRWIKNVPDSVRLRQSLHQLRPHFRVYFPFYICCVRGKFPWTYTYCILQEPVLSRYSLKHV